MNNLECNERCRAKSGKVNHDFCSLHRCWQCGSQAKFYSAFHTPRLNVNKQIGFCSNGCLASFRDNNPTWEYKGNY